MSRGFSAINDKEYLQMSLTFDLFLIFLKDLEEGSYVVISSDFFRMLFVGRDVLSIDGVELSSLFRQHFVVVEERHFVEEQIRLRKLGFRVFGFGTDLKLEEFVGP
jgi:hypothetical protein